MYIIPVLGHQSIDAADKSLKGPHIIKSLVSE
jgi:hypothetical protein